jgi:hypothetical protein
VVEDNEGDRDLEDLMEDGELAVYHLLVKPGIPIPKEATGLHEITDAQMADAPSVVEVANAAAAHIKKTLGALSVGRRRPRVWLLVHNSVGYENVCMGHLLAVRKPGGLDWLGRLRVAVGWVGQTTGTIGTLTILSNNYHGSAVGTHTVVWPLVVTSRPE